MGSLLGRRDTGDDSESPSDDRIAIPIIGTRDFLTPSDDVVSKYKSVVELTSLLFKSRAV